MMTRNPGRILVVDDAPLTRGLLEQALLKYGYSVDTAQNGQQAIDSFHEDHPDLILMDANMPVLDGVTACARIKALPEAKYLPILIVTALMEREWVDRAYAAGATDYITKPVNLDVLRNRIHYILQAKRAEEALFDEKEKAEITLASICDGVITTDAKGLVEFLNPVATNLTGWTTQAAQGLPLNSVFCIIDEKTQQPIDVPMECCLEEGKRIKIENPILLHRDRINQFAIEDSAAPIRDRHGKIIGAVLVFNDVTEKRKMTQALAYRATHDALTGLYNRDEFNLQLERMLQAPRDKNTEHALLYMDLDRFKIVNDTCGHEAGDQLLKDIALLLQKQINAHSCFKQTTLARLGGDEFALLLKNCSQQKAFALAHNLREAIEKFIFFWKTSPDEKGVFTIGISIGLVPISTQLNNSKSLIAMADAACYTAKNKGRNTVHIYQENDSEASHKNIQWVRLLNENLEKKQGFYLFYQSIIPLKEENDLSLAGSPKRCEILLRMKVDSQKNFVLPGAFLSAATRYHLMPTLDKWVIQSLLEWLKAHPQFLAQITFCSINLSGYSFRYQAFLETVIDDIDSSNIPANKLCFEIPETTLLSNFTDISYFMNALKKRGCRFAVDNFGSGIASFSYLKTIPIDFLKIDGRLINNITHDSVDYAMVKSINEIAHMMQIQTIAEHVENGITFEALKKIGLDYAQGYWIEEPQPFQ
ncbi:MAG: EAL domain-containing protein [Candidatus Parabeggiatoa sp.]|nr:EAL domain-containing protein [Candidatus Parabeggiatoa sp.]